MAKGSNKKPKEAKCRATSSPVEGRDWVKIGGKKWLREAAEKAGKFIPLEYRDSDGNVIKQSRADRKAAKEQAAFEAAMAEYNDDEEVDTEALAEDDDQSSLVEESALPKEEVLSPELAAIREIEAEEAEAEAEETEA